MSEKPHGKGNVRNIIVSKITYDCSSLDSIASVVACAWNWRQFTVGRSNVSQLVTEITTFVESLSSTWTSQRLVVDDIIWNGKEGIRFSTSKVVKV